MRRGGVRLPAAFLPAALLCMAATAAPRRLPPPLRLEALTRAERDTWVGARCDYALAGPGRAGTWVLSSGVEGEGALSKPCALLRLEGRLHRLHREPSRGAGGDGEDEVWSDGPLKVILHRTATTRGGEGTMGVEGTLTVALGARRHTWRVKGGCAC